VIVSPREEVLGPREYGRKKGVEDVASGGGKGRGKGGSWAKRRVLIFGTNRFRNKDSQE
jgi:hypothetical protein